MSHRFFAGMFVRRMHGMMLARATRHRTVGLLTGDLNLASRSAVVMVIHRRQQLFVIAHRVAMRGDNEEKL